MNIKRYIGFVWAGIPTLIGLLYVGLMTLLGWYKYVGRKGNAWIWTPKHVMCPFAVQKYWRSWAGHTIGNVVVVADPWYARVITHEQKHVEQYMYFGPLFIVVYLLGMLVAKLAGEHHYYMNPFEIAARRHANEVIDHMS